MILISKYLVPKGYTGLTIYPFVFLKHQKLKEDMTLINHERIHLRQQLELLIFPFYIIYVTEFLIRLLQYKGWKRAYRNISFERECYLNENNLGYLKTRKLWTFITYFKANEF
ncbi:hypothetical protein [Pontimicrobium aquaticum]|uniref:Peptidase M56 domain-containing protein n=1 Tax=Pontimicrobium aquaticum TaxID=2565367 RepID=A0A4U0EK68_9FLAO|nr:hypothetical protein [Pontimicrobium aquaticum]TJY31835.1 hypothetical protein E5167_14870 [Pontimicrobium aquaticum]